MVRGNLWAPRSLLAWQSPVTGDLAGLVVPWAGWPVATRDGREPYRLPGGDGVCAEAAGRISVIAQAAGPVRGDCPAPVGWTCGAGSVLAGGRGRHVGSRAAYASRSRQPRGCTPGEEGRARPSQAIEPMIDTCEYGSNLAPNSWAGDLPGR